MLNIGLFNLLFDKTFLVTMVAAVLAFATIATLVLPMMERGGLDDRLKSVAKRREELRAKHHAALNVRRGSLRIEPSTLMKSVLDKFKAREPSNTAFEEKLSKYAKVRGGGGG